MAEKNSAFIKFKNQSDALNAIYTVHHKVRDGVLIGRNWRRFWHDVQLDMSLFLTFLTKINI